jgi:hypothetical protein
MLCFFYPLPLLHYAIHPFVVILKIDCSQPVEFGGLCNIFGPFAGSRLRAFSYILIAWSGLPLSKNSRP